ncbi:hypothetical protein B484DRAFT_452198 [Ochromonadaceae sp. CCMP2298]|nr:hypothetical protein B484DRAFT_452198 [Ochromonadaceae sp. CCMP2298]
MRSYRYLCPLFMICILRFSASLLLQRPVASFGPHRFHRNNSKLSLSKLSSLSSVSDQSVMKKSGPITELRFDNRNLALPVDASLQRGSRQTPNTIFSLVDPTPVQKPLLVVRSQSALDLLGVSADEPDEQIAKYLGGCAVLPGSRPAAHCYCGHQFGNFAGQLGDGATMYLGEVVSEGVRWELQLKGAGKTPFSRTADGRKVLRSSVREFLCSEAMHALGVPTTRAASCTTSSSTVERDPFYDGGVIAEQCAVVSRIAPNFFRFGSFEIFKPKNPTDSYDRAGPSANNEALKRQLLDHVLGYFPHLGVGPAYGGPAYEAFFQEVVSSTAQLVARWQAVGFVHGVLNTDNMSVMGLTIDYGPYEFMGHYDENYCPNGSDGGARYSYQRQAEMCKWNLDTFAKMLSPLLSPEAGARILNEYDDIYQTQYETLVGAKFGLPPSPSPSSASMRWTAADRDLVESFFDVMQATGTDFTDAFVALTLHAEQIAGGGSAGAGVELVSRLTSRAASPSEVVEAQRRKMKIHKLSMHPSQIEQLWGLLQTEPAHTIEAMFNGAPIDAVRSQIGEEKRKLDLLVGASGQIKQAEMTAPASKREADRKLWASWCERYAARLGEGGKGVGVEAGARAASMAAANPAVVLRNWMAQDSILMAEKGDYLGVQVLHRLLQDPFHPQHRSFRGAESSSGGSGGAEADLVRRYTSAPPDWADGLICTCSS